MSRRRAVAWAVLSTTIAVTAIGCWLWALNAPRSPGVFSPQAFIVPGLATVGAIIASRTKNRLVQVVRDTMRPSHVSLCLAGQP